MWQFISRWLGMQSQPRAESSGYANPASWFVEWIRSPESDAGIVVDGRAALSYAPIWYAVNRIGGHVGQLPLDLYRRSGRRTEKATGHWAYSLVKRRPNAAMSSIMFRETLTLHTLLWGNGRAAIERDGRGFGTGLVPLLPWCTKTVLVNSEKWHVVETGHGEPDRIRDEDVLHIPGLSDDGLTGLSVIELAKNSWGLGMAAEKASNRHFRNNAIPGLILEAPPGVFPDEDQAKQFLSKFNEYHQGISNTNKIGMLREGIKANAIAMKATDAQWIEQRHFQRQDAALWMMLEQILGDDSSVSYNSLEQKHQAYLSNCLMRWLVKWEQELDEKLLTEAEREDHYFKFNVKGLLRGTAAERFQVYAIGIANRIFSPNEVRELEELDPYEGGDTYENPAITPGQSGQRDDDEQDDEQNDDQQEETAAQAESQSARNALIASRFKSLLEQEAKYVIAAASRVTNFVAWLDSFYGGSFWETIERNVSRSGGEPSLAAKWLTESHESLLEAAGKAKTDTLEECVRDAVSRWGTRSQQMADEICKGA